ncbi:uracil-DNA glycosylase [Candidatus Gracilibacteria bacterium]|nr:uracil-DNA glycosylase [Candidatus Gracilibacteria bacterium]
MLNTINNNWSDFLNNEFKKEYFLEIEKYLQKEYENNKIIFPQKKDIFNAFLKTDFLDVKVVILGQDPYHNESQAHGLSFSVLPGVKIPPSLKNIFKELNSDLGVELPKNGNLENWADSGVLLLNAILTVEKNKPGSHSKIGWEIFTNNVIKYISNNLENVVFVLWGNFAKGKMDLINKDKHFIISSVHPSPFSAHNGFFGSKPFSKINNYFRENNKKEIDFKL